MPLEHANEAQRLADHYSRMYDGELLNLGAESADLTEIAQQALSNEIKKRGLDLEPKSRAPASDSREPNSSPPSTWGTHLASPDDDIDPGEERPFEFSWKAPLCDCEGREQAWQIFEVLRRAGIESWIQAPTKYSSDSNGPRVSVAADQLDEAREIIAQPIPQDIVDDSKMEIPEYELPTCPHCGASDPILEDAEGGNSWACEACGKQWTDSAEDFGDKALE